MIDQTSGLRFDIYERVHLPDHVDGIFELEEIELTPHIQVQEDEARTLLKGHLQLSGKYVAEGGAEESRSLDFRIPVEITLPMNRSHQTPEQIDAEIENFDVDLISTRSLNVTGVLSLRGVTLGDQQNGQWNEEDEVVVVHQVGANVERIEPSKVSVASGEEEWQNVKPEDVEPEVAKLESAELESADPEAAEPEQIKELKIAFTGKKLQEELSAKAPESEPLSSASALLNPTSPIPAVSIPTPPVAPISASIAGEHPAKSDSGTAPSSSNDALEWKKLFLPDHQEARFTRMKMCIVQKEETVETIAERYGMNAREIVLFNRLGEQEISEGQILYIPR